jgi:hypothetical protein
MTRLLICNTHKTVDPLNNYVTDTDPDGKYDHDLKDAIDRHLDQYGSDPGMHDSQLAWIDDKEYQLLDPKRLEEAFHNGELEQYLSDERDNYKAQAMTCFSLHGRPQGGCIDWCEDNRAIGAIKGIAREDRQYLCYFCPVASHVAVALRTQAGLYGK